MSYISYHLHACPSSSWLLNFVWNSVLIGMEGVNKIFIFGFFSCCMHTGHIGDQTFMQRFAYRNSGVKTFNMILPYIKTRPDVSHLTNKSTLARTRENKNHQANLHNKDRKSVLTVISTQTDS